MTWRASTLGPSRRTTPIVTLAMTAGLAACPLPQNDPRGLELAWMFVERNAADGERGLALRTCDGALAQDVEVTVTDQRDPSRTRSFSWSCEESWASPDLFFVAPPPVFIDLREGTYVVDTLARDEFDVFTRELATIGVDATTTTSLLVALALPGATLELQLDSLDACDDVALRVRYADAEADVLGAPPRDPVDSYRDALVSDEGVSLDGGAISCATLPDRLTLHDVDRGRYVLEYVVDAGPACVAPLLVRGDNERVTLDLAAPCPR